MSPTDAILVLGAEELFIELLGRFPASRYRLVYAEGLVEAQRRYNATRPKLVVVNVDGSGWQLTPVLRDARNDGVGVLGVTVRADSSWIPDAVARVLPAKDLDAVVAAAGRLLEDRRQWPRIEVELPLQIEGIGRLRATAASGGWLFVPLSEPPPSGQQVALAFEIEGRAVACSATVVRSGSGEGGETGVVLELLDHQARSRLRAIVQHKLMVDHFERVKAQPDQAGFSEALRRRLAMRSRQLLLATYGAEEGSEEGPAEDRAGQTPSEEGPAEDGAGQTPAEEGPAEEGPAEPGPAEPGPADEDQGTLLRQIHALGTRVDGLEQQGAQLRALAQQLDSQAWLINAINDRLDRLGDLPPRVTRLEQLEVHLEQLGQRIEGQGGRTDGISATLQELQERVDAQARTLGGFGERLEALTVTLRAEQRQAGVALEHQIQQSLDEQSALIEAVNENQRELQSRLDANGAEIARRLERLDGSTSEAHSEALDQRLEQQELHLDQIEGEQRALRQALGSATEAIRALGQRQKQQSGEVMAAPQGSLWQTELSRLLQVQGEMKQQVETQAATLSSLHRRMERLGQDEIQRLDQQRTALERLDTLATLVNAVAQRVDEHQRAILLQHDTVNELGSRVEQGKTTPAAPPSPAVEASADVVAQMREETDLKDLTRQLRDALRQAQSSFRSSQVDSSEK